MLLILLILLYIYLFLHYILRFFWRKKYYYCGFLWLSFVRKCSLCTKCHKKGLLIILRNKESRPSIMLFFYESIPALFWFNVEDLGFNHDDVFCKVKGTFPFCKLKKEKPWESFPQSSLMNFWVMSPKLFGYHFQSLWLGFLPHNCFCWNLK